MASSNGYDKSLSELEREAERNRAELLHTVDALQSRVSPQALKADVKDYVRHTGQDLVDTVQQRARDNPLQAVAIAAGLAYPLWRMVSSIPVPLLLIGGGLALMRSGGGPGGDNLGNQLYEQAREKFDQAREKVGEAVGAVQERVHDATASLQQTASGIAGQASRMAGQVSSGVQSKVQSASERVSGAASDTTSSASHLAERASSMPAEIYEGGMQAARRGMDTVQHGVDHMRDATSRGMDRAARFGRRAQGSALDAIEQHPLLVGALGLAAGAAIAAAFPSTRVEGRVFGATSDRIKGRASDFASEGADRAWSAANDAYEAALREARAQGLTPEALQQAVREVAERTKAAARKAASDGNAASMADHG